MIRPDRVQVFMTCQPTILLPEGEREDVSSPEYWQQRISKCAGDLQRAMFDGTNDAFAEYHKRQMTLVQRHVNATDSVLDVGCAYGRLLTLLPSDWTGNYVGIDISPEFIALAKILHPNRHFICDDVPAYCEWTNAMFDVGVCLWLRGMLIRNGKSDEWDKIKDVLLKVCGRVLAID